MKRLLILGVIAVSAMILAACGGGGGDPSGSAAPPDTGSATVSVRQVGGAGRVLVDSSGQALYASDQENAAGMVLCTEGCTSFWSPLTVSGSPTGSSVPGDLGVVKRPDGESQVSLDGKLLYSFVQDQPGEVSGDGFEDAFGGQTLTWHVVHADGSTTSGGTTTGPYGY